MKQKQILCLLLIVLLLVSGSFAEDSTGFDLSAMAEDFILVVNADNPTEAVLGLEKNADLPCYPASTTKILTCILAIENGDLSAKVTVPSSADSDRVLGSAMGIHAKEVFTLEDLLYGMMLPSGNDAAIAVAVALSGSTDAFVKRMNEKAEALGMTHSHFANPNGLHDENHYSTARDMAILSAYAMQNETFRTIVGTAERTVTSKEGRKITVRSSNRFLRDSRSTTFTPESVLYADAVGIKTGETNVAGKCLVAAATRNDTTYIALLFHGEMPPDKLKAEQKDAYSTQRFKDARTLLEYAFEHDLRSVSVKDLLQCGLPKTRTVEHDPDTALMLSSTEVIDWNPDDVYLAEAYKVPKELTGDTIADCVEYTLFDVPYRVGETVGKATVRIDGFAYFSAPIRVEAIERPTPPPTPDPTPVPTLSGEVYEFDLTAPTASPSPTPAPAATAKPGWLSCAPKR